MSLVPDVRVDVQADVALQSLQLLHGDSFKWQGKRVPRHSGKQLVGKLRRMQAVR